MTGTVATQVKTIAFDHDIERLTEGFTGREWVFEEVDRWLQQDNERFFILTGEPGVGKSAIAARLTQLRLDIAAYHFCMAGRSGTIEPNNVLLSLAAQLIDYFPDYAEALANTIKPLRLSVNVEITIETIKDSEVRGVVINNLHTQNPQEALNVVLQRALAALPNPPQQPVLLLIDSLDEAVTLRGDNNLVTLLAETNDLPPWVRFVFTTRPERRVLRYFEQLKPYTLVAESQMNLDDIRQYIENRVGKEKMQAQLQLAEVEPQTFVNRLTELSTGNFLYTKILLNDIEAGRQTLDDLSALPQSLDEIYHGFLKRFTVTEWEERYQPILGVLAVAQEPITEVQLAHFTGIGQGKIRQNLGVVRQFLDISDDGHGRETFSVFHQSLRDYLLNEQRNIDFWCEAKEQHQRIVDYYMADDQSWHTKPTSDRYLWHHFAYHLSGASKNSELRGLLFNFDWLQAKLDATDVNALIADFDFLSNDSNLSLVQSAIRLSAHILANDKKQLAGQLLGRLLQYEAPKIQDMLEQTKQWKAVPWLRPLTSSLMPPEVPLLRTLMPSLMGHYSSIKAVAVMPDGQRAISVFSDSTIKIWNLVNESERTLSLDDYTWSIEAIAVTPDGQKLISVSRSFNLKSTETHILKVWDLESGTELRTLGEYTLFIRAVTVTSDGKYAISTSDGSAIKVWDLETGAELRTLTSSCLFVETIAVTPDGKYLISALSGGTLEVWDLEREARLYTIYGHSDDITALAVMPDGQSFISASWDNTLKVWDLASGTELRTLSGHTGWVLAVAVTSDGEYAISASNDCTLKVWNLKSGAELRTLIGHTSDVISVAVTPDGKCAISGSQDNTVKVWDLNSSAEPLTSAAHAGGVRAVVVTPDGQHAISASNDTTLKVWNLENRAELRTLIGHTSNVISVAVTPDGQQVISASHDNTLKIWDLESGTELHTLNGHDQGVTAMAVTSDGQFAVSASMDRTIKVWDLNSGTARLSFLSQKDRVQAIAVTPDSQLAISDLDDKNFKVWDLESGAEQLALCGHTSYVTTVVVTPNGKYAISGSEDWTLRVWDLQTGAVRFTLYGHSATITAVTVTLDSQYVLSTARDHTLKVWDLANGKAIASFTGDSILHTCAVAPDGVTIIAGEASGRVHFLLFEEVQAYQRHWRSQIAKPQGGFKALVAESQSRKKPGKKRPRGFGNFSQ